MTSPEVGQDLVGLRKTDINLFQRAPGHLWRVDYESLDRVIDSLTKLGYVIERRWSLATELDAYLLDLEYFYPGAIPSSWSALVNVLNEERAVLAGETLNVLGESSYDRYGHLREESRSVLRGERVSRRETEALVREDLKLKISDIALRPLVGTTENAARAKWHYGMWGIYQRTDRGPTDLLAIYGHRKGGSEGETWIVASHDDHPWWAPSLRDYARIGCAVTGRTLFEWGRKSNTEDRLTPELFLGDPPEMNAAGEMDTITFAADPIGRPKLGVM